FGEFAMCFSDLIVASRRPDQVSAHMGPLRGIEQLLRQEGAVVSLTAHVGNWELAGRVLAQHSARPTHVVVAMEEARALERWLRRDGDGVRFVARAQPTVSLTLMAALRRGEAVALQGDRALGNRGDVMVPFFGRPAPFPVGPFQLARAAAVPLVPAFCTLGADREYVVRVLDPLPVVRGAEEDGLRTWVANLERGRARVPVEWILRRIGRRGILEQSEGGGATRFRLIGKLPDLDPLAVREEQRHLDPSWLPSYVLAETVAKDYPAFLRGERVGEEILFSPLRLRLWVDFFSNDNGLYAVNNSVGAGAVEEWMPRGPATIVELG